MSRIVRKCALCALAAVLVLFIVAAGLYWSWVRIASDVKIFAPDGWAELEGRTELMTSPDQGVVLIQRTTVGERPPAPSTDAVSVSQEPYLVRYYQYDPVTDNVTVADAHAWDLLAGRVTTCGEEYTPIKEVYGKRVSGQAMLMIDGSKLPVAAAGPGKSAVSPTGELVVVVSADAEIELSLIMGGGGRFGSQRQHYCQVASLKEEAWVGEPLRIPMVTRLAGRRAKPGRDYLVGICWSADERYVVYVGRTSLCIVPVERQGDLAGGTN